MHLGFDILGNVWEWVWDNWQPYADRATIGDDWTLEGPAEGEDRVKRGGGYFILRPSVRWPA